MEAAKMQPISDLLGSLRALITPEVTAKASSVFGESEAAVSTAFGAALPTVLGAVASKADDRSFMSRLFDLIKEPAADGSYLSSVANLIDPGASNSPAAGIGSRFMSMVFGGGTYSLSNALSSFAGVKPSTGASILTMAGPLVLGVLGRTVGKNGLDSAGLSDLLLRQKSSLSAFIPDSLSSLLGTTTQTAQTAVRTVETAAASPWRRWVLTGLLLLLGLWGLLSLLNNRGRDVTDYISKVLPGGFQLRYPTTGIEGKMITFITDPTQLVDGQVWFNFDRLLFSTDSASLRPESREQLRNIAEILKAYPSVAIKIGGYTDNSGDPAANLNLSQERANSVRQELLGLGIAPERIIAEGYGQQHPVADNSTEEGRAQNRRVALQITNK